MEKINQRVIGQNKKIKYNYDTINQRDMGISPQYGRQINVEEKGMKNLTQAFSDLVRLRQDSWECYPGFITFNLKKSLNP
jgi:hypothetical protein